MTETSKEELQIVNKNLQEEIDKLDRRISLIPDPFSKLSMLQVQKGGTGAARIRRIFLSTPSFGSIAEVGNFDSMMHAAFANGGILRIYMVPVIIPTDYIAISNMSINYFHSNSTTTGDVDWVINVRSIEDGDTAETSLLSDTTSVTVGGVANTIALRSINLTTLPKTDVAIFVDIQRTGGADSNSGAESVWGAWLEYVAFI